MHKQDAIHLDQLCPKISNKSWKESLHKITRYKCIYCGKPSESLDHLHPMSRGGKVTHLIACHVVCHAMGRNQIRKFLLGTENKISMILEGQWR